MWKAARVSASAAENMQVEAGVLLSTVSLEKTGDRITGINEISDSDIICATSGDFAIKCTPQFTDFFEDVNNAPNNTKEGKRITGWDASLGITCIEITEDTLKMALGAAVVDEDDGINPAGQVSTSDFKTLYWLGDMVDDDKALLIKLGDTINTSGIDLSTKKNGKGALNLTLVPHISLATPDVMPMTFYLLEKVESE